MSFQPQVYTLKIQLRKKQRKPKKVWYSRGKIKKYFMVGLSTEKVIGDFDNKDIRGIGVTGDDWGEFRRGLRIRN